ncbi:MAG TPA: AAA family ATPase [Albitalea sp.]
MHLHLAASPRFVGTDGSSAPLAARDAALLAWLALEGPTSRVRLASLLWPGSAPEVARNALRQRLFQLKKQLGMALVSGDETLALADGVGHDLHEADSVLGQAAHEHSPEFAAWITRQRQRRTRRTHDALVELAAMAERSQDYADALSHAQEALALEPLAEDAHRRVMRLHYLRGDRAGALLAFDRCEQVLKDEVGAAPSAETLALLATVERSVSAASPHTAAPVPPAVQRPPLLIGRNAELQALALAADDAAVVLVEGEAGMGKSRLIEELMAGAAASRWLPVCARPGDAAVPYSLAARWLRGLLLRIGVQPSDAQRADLALVLPEFGAPAPRMRAERSRLGSAVQALLEQAARGGLRAVIVDDLQYADAASVELLHPLVGAAPCGWVIAMRPHELGAAARSLVEAHAASTRARAVQLQPLDAPSIAALLDSLAIDGVAGLAQAESLHRRTGGNPLYLLETLKVALAAGSRGARPTGALAMRPVPAPAPGEPGIAWPRADNVLRLIQQRLTRLSPLALKLARCAALAGQDLSSPLAAQVLGLRPLDLADAWAELEAAQVLREGAFAHDLIAEAALALVPQPIARALHAEIATFLERAEGEPARMAEHWLAAGERRKAVPCLTHAARRAHAAWQRAQAARLHEEAATILRELGERRAAFDAFFAAAEALSEVAMDERMEGYRAALAELADDDGQRAMVAVVQAAWLVEHRRFDEARGAVLEALPRAERAGLADIEVELLWDMVVLHWERRELADAARRAEQALARLAAADPAGARLDMAGTRFKLTHALGVILSSTGCYAQADAQLAQALQLARRDRQLSSTGSIANSLALNALAQGSLERALAWSEQAVTDDDREGGVATNRVQAVSSRALIVAAGGDLGAALAASERAAQLCDRLSIRFEVLIRRRLHGLQFELGRRDLTLKGLRALRERADLLAHERMQIDAELLRAGEPVDAAALLEQAVTMDDFSLRVRLLCLLQPGCEPQRIAAILALSAATARDQGAHGLWLALQTARVAALRLQGRSDEACEQAIAVWQRADEGVVGAELFPRVAAELCAALTDRRPELMRLIALRASGWMVRAAATLPAGWRENYLARAPILQILPPRARGMLFASRA